MTELEAVATTPGFWNDQNKARASIDEARQHKAILDPYRKLERAMQDADVLIELGTHESEEAQRTHALAEAGTAITAAERTFTDIEFRSLLSGKLDRNSAFLTLHAGAGGTESCDWADMLFRMYRRYCEDHSFQVEILDYQPGDEAGIKRVTFGVSGEFAYGYMKSERGVHRLVRISPFDSNKRRHTSFVALDVVAELTDDVEIEIDEKDLRIDTYRSSGAGGQHVNKTDSAIRITHLPTNIIVSCQAERSQHKNRSKAMSMLRARLYDWTMDRKRKDMEKFYGDKGDIAWGSQIRSYVLQPYTLVKDHRTEHETSNVAAVLDGDIQGFIEAYLRLHAGEDMKVDAAPATAARGV